MIVSGRRSDLISGTIVLLFGAFWVAEGTGMPYWTEGGNPGPAFLPTLLGSTLMLLSLSLILRAFRAGAGGTGTTSITLSGSALRRSGSVLLALVLYVMLFPVLGYLISSSLFCGSLLWIFNTDESPRRKAIKAVLVSVALSALFSIIFVYILSLQVEVWPPALMP